MRYSPMEGEVFICLKPSLTWPVGRVKAHWAGSGRIRTLLPRAQPTREMLLTSLSPALHCVVRSHNLNMLTEDDIKNALKAVKYPGYRSEERRVGKECRSR